LASLVSKFDAGFAYFSDSLFNLADEAFWTFPSFFSCSAVSFQVRVSGKLTRLLFDCAFDFVEIACGLIVPAQVSS